jgi:hypothetical protein
MTNQAYLNNYFANHWGHNGVPKYSITGIDLAKRIKDEEWVLDVGCGRNLFKSTIKNLVGIDPAFDEADVKTTIEEFQSAQRFDVALCLGSINFGGIESIRKQITSVIKYLKPQARIYWRCNPGLQDHDNKECEQIEFFPWSEQWHVTLSKEYGFNLEDFGIDSNRIYAEWKRT